MELEEALHVWASTQSTIVAAIGEPTRLRFFKLSIPQSSRFPASVVQRSSTQEQTLACRVDGTVGVSLQLDHYGKDWASAAALARIWRQALNPNPLPYPMTFGPLGDSPAAGVKVKAAIKEQEFDVDDPEPGLFRRTQLWTFWIAQT